MNLRKRLYCSSVCLIVTILSCTANAVPISGLSATGVNGIGVVDPNYTMRSYIPGGWRPSVPTTAIGIVKHPAWIAAPGGSNWMGVTNGDVSDRENFIFNYQLNFDLSGLDESTAGISGLWAVDDSVELFLNGALVAATSGFSSLKSFSFDTGFLTGINTLNFKVFNGGGAIGNPSGLLVSSLSGTVNEFPSPSVPEPSLLVLLSIGLIGMGVVRKYTIV